MKDKSKPELTSLQGEHAFSLRRVEAYCVSHRKRVNSSTVGPRLANTLSL